MPGPELSIIIVSYNTAAHLRRCLRSLVEHRPTCSFEVVVVDNGSTDGSADLVATEFGATRLVSRPANDGYGVALNEGVSASRGMTLMFLNPDVEVSAGSVDHLRRFLVDHPGAGVVGPRLLRSDGSAQASAKHFASVWRLVLEASRLHLLLPKRLRASVLLGTYFDQCQTRRVSWVSGACHVLLKSVWDEVGPLTEETFCGFDDYDFCFRAHAKGYEVWIDAQCSMTHHCSVAVRDRWSEWEIEQVAIHNTYIVLEAHSAWWRVKLLLAAEVATYAGEWLRVQITAGSRAQKRGKAELLGRRVALLAALLIGWQRPIHRFGASPDGP